MNKKIETVKYQLQSTNIKKIRGFLRSANFYRCFVEGFGRLTIPFIKFIKNDKAFEQIQRQQDIFDQIKYKITSKPILAIIDLNKFFEVEIDISDFAFGGQFAQQDEERRLYLIAFFLKKLYKLEFNYLSIIKN